MTSQLKSRDLIKYPSRPPFIVYVMWHPDSDACAQMADRIRQHFQSRRFRFVMGNDNVEVLFHNSRTPNDSPLKVNWYTSCPIAVVTLIDAFFTADTDWRLYIHRLGEQAATVGRGARMIPVAMESSVLDNVSLTEQAVRLDTWRASAEESGTRLLRTLTYEFARMLRTHLSYMRDRNEDINEFERYLEKIPIFLSYSRHDNHGADIANDIRCWLHANSALASFLDMHDIPAGLRFPQVIEHHIEQSVMLAIYTDSYSSREWCRREVISAKRNDVPMVVADCLDKGDDRAFPYLGNVPVVRMHPESRDGIPRVVACLLDELFRNLLWNTRLEGLREVLPCPIFMGYPPEFVSLASRGVKPGQEGVVVHPDPPLGAEERSLIESTWGDLKLLSINQWLAGIQ